MENRLRTLLKIYSKNLFAAE